MQTYNGDETGVTIVFKLGKIVAELRQRNVYSVSAAERLKTHTILSCVSACGFVLPPMMIYPCKGRCLPQYSFFFLLVVRLGGLMHSSNLTGSSSYLKMFHQYCQFRMDTIHMY